MRIIKCREHGGTFSIEPRRGRPPVRCTEDNRCGKAVTSRLKSETETTTDPVSGIKIPVAQPRRGTPEHRDVQVTAGMERKRVRRAAEDAPIPPVAVAEVTTFVNPSVPLAHAAKQRLEPLGWSVSGKTLNMRLGAVVTAIRGDELITLQWENGELIAQNYTVWNMELPTVNAKPEHSLPFDPDEIPDRELVQALYGTRVTWWNALGRVEETAIIIGSTVTVEHQFTGVGDETPADRIIKFIAKDAGFRAFRLGALLKVR